MLFNTKIGCRGYYTVEKFNKDGVIWSNTFGNKLTYNFADAYVGTEMDMDASASIAVGTDNTDPTPSDTSLGTQVSTQSASISTSQNTSEEYALYEASNQWSIGSLSGNTLAEVGLYVGGMSNIASRQLFRAVESVTDEVLASGDGSTATYSVETTGDYLEPNTITITAPDTGGTTMTVTDDGDGNLTGDVGSGTNTVDYRTGEINVTFTNDVQSGADILIDYDWNAPTTISMTSEDGLRVWYYIRFYLTWSGDASSTGLTFTFDQNGTNVTKTYDVSFDLSNDLVGLAKRSVGTELQSIAAYDSSGSKLAGANSVSSSMVNNAATNSGVAVADYQGTWDPGTISDGETVGEVRSDYGSMYKFQLQSSSYIENLQDTEQLKLTLRFSMEINI